MALKAMCKFQGSLMLYDKKDVAILWTWRKCGGIDALLG
jgi:hypothetical protein